nr:glycosyltransferase [Kiritimatiellia bacterium]
MKTPLPRVSVVVLTHNRLRMLRDAVRTLQEQDYPPELLEIIVVNDGSRDGTREWLDRQQSADPRLRAVHQEPRGIPAARNAGIRASGGDLVAIVADDYLMAPDYVKTFVSFLQEHPEAGVVRFGIIPASRWPGSLVSHFYYEVCFRRRLQQPRLWPEGASRMEKLRTYFRRLPKAPEGLSTNNMLEAAGAAAFRKEVFDRVGLFDETIKRGEDTDMSIRMRKEGIVMVYDPSHKIRHRYGRWGGDTLKKTFM